MLAFRNDRFSPSGTDGSNPLPSTGESPTNLSSPIRAPDIAMTHAHSSSCRGCPAERKCPVTMVISDKDMNVDLVVIRVEAM